MYCENCGDKLIEDAKFCERCGLKIGLRPSKKYTNVKSVELTQSNGVKFLIIGICIALVLGGIWIYENQQQQIKDLAQSQQKLVEQTTRATQEAKDANSAAQKAAQDAKNERTINQANIVDYAKLASEWKNRVVKVYCFFPSYTSQGSGTLVDVQNYGIVAVTNAHVAFDVNGYRPNDCIIGSVYNGLRTVGDPDQNVFYSWANNGFDMAYIKLSHPVISPTDNSFFDTVVSSHLKVCKLGDAILGDKIVIFGYPWNGSQYGVTVTQGIISGTDGNYYVTDAKIDHGSSGGASILIKDDCWLGIPSAAIAGTIESYARILRSDIVLNSN